MRTMPVMVLLAMVGALALGTVLSACATPVPAAGGSGGGTEPLLYEQPMDLGVPGVPLETVTGVPGYPACGTETITYAGVTWYPFEPANLAVFPTPPIVVGDGGLGGGTMRIVLPSVVAPGPGDDVGTLTIYEGGFAYWISASGDLATWLTDRELTYAWVC